MLRGFGKNMIYKRFSGSGMLFPVLVLLFIFIAQSTLPRFGTFHHQHEGNNPGHVHPALQFFQSETPEADKGGFHAHAHKKRTRAVQVRPSASKFTVLSQIDLFDQGHLHAYDHFIPLFFVEKTNNNAFLPFQTIDFHIDQTWLRDDDIFVNPRAPPFLI